MIKAIYDIPAPAKLNTFLHVVGQKNDGYHLIQSVFALISWFDVMHITRRSSGLFSREDLNTQAGQDPLPEQDLCLRAAALLAQETGSRHGAHITLEKKIPTQAGLGGGSSDAASTLIALNRLWQTNLSREQLAAIGLKLGSDVPFFITGRHAWVEGTGEIITPIELPSSAFIIIKPPSGIETAKIFNDPRLRRDTKTATMTDFKEGLYSFGKNDLQEVANQQNEGISKSLEVLKSCGLLAKMTGSGSCVFSACSIDAANKAATKAKEILGPNFEIKVCNLLQSHPLLDWC